MDFNIDLHNCFPWVDVPFETFVQVVPKSRSHFWFFFFFFTKKVTRNISIFPSANFPQEKFFFMQAIYFSSRNQFFLLWYKVLLHDLVNQTERSTAKSAEMHETNVLVVKHESSVLEVCGKPSLIGRFCFLHSFFVRNFPEMLAV